MMIPAYMMGQFSASALTPRQTRQKRLGLNRSFEYHRYFNLFVSSSFIKHFNFIGLKSVTSCQEWFGEGAAITVARWWTVGVSKVCVGICVGWGVTGNVNIASSTKCGSIAWTTVYGMATRTILSCLRQFHWCPAWLVNQWEKKGLWTVQVFTIGN